MIYLSFCIPTYNRSTYLRQTIESIISQKEFTDSDEVEVIVSDNNSTDDTNCIMSLYTEKYPTKIKYYRNSENIKDYNYEKVLSYGNGQILKLHNDTLTLLPNSLGKIINIVKYSIQGNYFPYFTDGYLRDILKPVVCNNKYDFLELVSYRITWIGSFSIYRDSFNEIETFSDRAELMLCQVDVIFKLLEKGVTFLIIPDKLFSTVSPLSKGGYNLPKVFLINYFIILRDYFDRESDIVFLEKQLRKTAFEFVLPWLIRIYINKLLFGKKYEFEFNGYQIIIKESFNTKTLMHFECKLFLGIFYSMLIIISKNALHKIRITRKMLSFK